MLAGPGGQTQDPPPDSFAGFEQGDIEAQAFQQAGGHQPRQAGADHHDGCSGGRGCRFSWGSIGLVFGLVQGHGLTLPAPTPSADVCGHEQSGVAESGTVGSN